MKFFLIFFNLIFMTKAIENSNGFQFTRAIPSDAAQYQTLFEEVKTFQGVNSVIQCAGIALKNTNFNEKMGLTESAFKYDEIQQKCTYGRLPFRDVATFRRNEYISPVDNKNPDNIYICLDAPLPQKVSQYYMISGGYKDCPDESKYDQLLKSDFSEDSCSLNSIVPFDIYSVGVYHNDIPLTCEQECYLYDFEQQSWILSNIRLKYDRSRSAFIELGYNEYWFTGGYDNSYDPIATTEILKDGVSEYNIDLPVKMSRHCFVKLNTKYAFIGGGFHINSSGHYYSSSDYYFVDLASKSFEAIPSGVMEADRAPVCSWFINSQGIQTIVVASGVSTSTYFVNIQTRVWVDGGTYINTGGPLRNRFAVHYEGDPYFLSGWHSASSSCGQEIYKLDSDGQWSSITTKFNHGKDGYMIFQIPEGIEISC